MSWLPTLHFALRLCRRHPFPSEFDLSCETLNGRKKAEFSAPSVLCGGKGCCLPRSCVRIDTVPQARNLKLLSRKFPKPVRIHPVLGARAAALVRDSVRCVNPLRPVAEIMFFSAGVWF